MSSSSSPSSEASSIISSSSSSSPSASGYRFFLFVLDGLDVLGLGIVADRRRLFLDRGRRARRGALSETPRGHRACCISDRSPARAADRNSGCRSLGRSAWCPIRVWPSVAPCRVVANVKPPRHCHSRRILSKPNAPPALARLRHMGRRQGPRKSAIRLMPDDLRSHSPMPVSAPLAAARPQGAAPGNDPRARRQIDLASRADAGRARGRPHRDLRAARRRGRAAHRRGDARDGRRRRARRRRALAGRRGRASAGSPSRQTCSISAIPAPARGCCWACWRRIRSPASSPATRRCAAGRCAA